jgi:hypothetical protein
MSLEIAGRFGWRPVTGAEREALRIHYSAEARAFGAHDPMPATLGEMAAFRERYLDTQATFEPQNRRLADAFMGYLTGLFPRPLRPAARAILLAQVDPRVLRACGLPVPSATRKRVSDTLMRTIGWAGPIADPVPGKPTGMDRIVSAVYPHGWSISDLGPAQDRTFGGTRPDS